MIVRVPTLADILAICRNLRPESAAEAFASLPHNDPDMLAELVLFLAKRADFVRALCDGEGAPLMLIGITPHGPGKGGMLFLAAEGADRIALATTRWWRDTFRRDVMERYRRIEFTGSAPGTRSGQWLNSVGFECEGPARSYGKDGSDFGHWAWVNPGAAAPAVDDGEAALRSHGLIAEGAAPHV